MFCRLRWHRENGLMNRSKRRWFPKKPICDGGTRGFTIVGLQEVKPALFLLLYGTLLAFVLMYMEIATQRAMVWYNDRFDIARKSQSNGLHFVTNGIRNSIPLEIPMKIQEKTDF